jgi:hypothetical protein
VTEQQILVASFAQLGMALCLAGIVLRNRFRFSRCFSLYLAACLAGNLSVTLWPDVFFTRGWYMTRNILYGTLRLAVALELVYWTFSALPGAHRAARRTLLAVLGITFLSLVILPDGGGEDSVRLVLLPRMLNGCIWLFAATVGIGLLYRVPVHPWHKAIMVGFAAYLTVFTVLTRLIAVLGWDFLDTVATLDPLSYVALLGYWTWAAWRTDEVAEADREVLSTLQPWRV